MNVEACAANLYRDSAYCTHAASIVIVVARLASSSCLIMLLPGNVSQWPVCHGNSLCELSGVFIPLARCPHYIYKLEIAF
jgi:hypothetical protein